jgi:hypothetical protein
MRHDVKILRGSNRRCWCAAAIAGAAVLAAAAGAEAGDGHWKKKHGRYFVPLGHVYYVAPPPVYYYRPAPVVVYPEPVYVPRYRYYREPSLSVTIPLR